MDCKLSEPTKWIANYQSNADDFHPFVQSRGIKHASYTLNNYLNTLHDFFSSISVEFSSTKGSVILFTSHNKEFNSEPQVTMCETI